MNRIIKFCSVIMIVVTVILVSFSNFKGPENNTLSLGDLMKVSTATAELYPGENPYLQNCMPCPVGVKFYCAMAGWSRCFNQDCGGGYC